MLLAFAATGSVGLVLGVWFRAPALIAASGVTAVVCLSVAPFTELELGVSGGHDVRAGWRASGRIPRRPHTVPCLVEVVPAHLALAERVRRVPANPD